MTVGETGFVFAFAALFSLLLGYLFGRSDGMVAQIWILPYDLGVALILGAASFLFHGNVRCMVVGSAAGAGSFYFGCVAIGVGARRLDWMKANGAAALIEAMKLGDDPEAMKHLVLAPGFDDDLRSFKASWCEPSLLSFPWFVLDRILYLRYRIWRLTRAAERITSSGGSS